MTLNDLIAEVLKIKEKLSPEEQKHIEQFNEVAKRMYLGLRHLAERDDLGYWYQDFAKSTINSIDKMVEESSDGLPKQEEK